MKSIIIVMICIVFCLQSYAQQEPQYSQYMYNMSLVNPGYVIDDVSVINVGSLYRTQWVGIEGAPKTANVFVQVPITEKVQLAVNYSNDQIGDAIEQNTNIFNIDFSYITQLSDSFKLSYGLKAGIDNFSLNATNSDVAGDLAFSDTNATNLLIGAGLYGFTHNFYVGISSPNLLGGSITTNDDVSVSESKSHIYLVSGYVIDLSSDVKLKPSTVIKQVFDAPITFDFSLNALFYGKFEIGVSYRYDDALIGLAGYNITNNLRIGYAYDYNLSELQDYNNGSHEIILLYNFDLLGLSNKHTSPRFF